MMTNIQQVPMPEGMIRPETGPMRFDDDWTGIFIRGDDVLASIRALDEAIKECKNSLTACYLKSLRTVFSEGIIPSEPAR